MNKTNFLVVLLVAVAVCSIVLFSSVFVVLGADHNCMGECCEICCLISNIENTIKTLALAVLLIAAMLALIYASTIFCISLVEAHQNNSLIKLKTKLSN